ncbi:MAG: hypothetical protein V1904_13660, partial [Bacteroidota bacterium]
MKKFILSLMLPLFFILFHAPQLDAVNYYWVSGTGNWDDLTHWAMSSGGTAYHVQIPTANDDVIFDGNSFTGSGQSVTINVSTALCNNMDWSGAQYSPILKGVNSNNLKIFGSLSLINDMNYSFGGKIYFEATTQGKYIYSGGKQFLNNVYFNGAGGGWTLLDSLRTNNTLYFNNGSLNTNNQLLRVGSINSNVITQRYLSLGSSDIVLTSANSKAFYVDFTNLNFNAGTSTIRFINNNDACVGIYSTGASADITFYNIEFSGTNTIDSITNSTGKSFIFNNVTFAGNAGVKGNNYFNGTLTLSSGKTYVFESGTTQTINGTIIAAGSCGNNILIRSSGNGELAYLSKANGIINIDYILIKDISAIGGAVWNATNSSIISNSYGWNVTSTANQTDYLYWIGGSGSWSDPIHWSFSSGGLSNISNCVPGPLNNVYFDANSFSANNQKVTIDVNNAFCNNMDWTGALYNPELTGDSSKELKIFGSLKFINAMILTFEGPVYFAATVSGKIIQSEGQVFKGNVCFDDPGGGWILQDDFSASSQTVVLRYGSLNTNNKNAIMGCLNTNFSNQRSLSLGSSKVTFDGSCPETFHIGFTNFTFDAGTSTLSFLGVDDGFQAGIYSNVSDTVQTFYDVEFVVGGEYGSIINNTGQNFIFNDVTFMGNGRFYGNNIYNNLVFAEGKSYLLKSGSKQSIMNNLSAAGNCEKNINIYSSNSGFKAYFSKSSGTVNVDHVTFIDNGAIGGAVWNATNSVIISNTSGWNVTNAATTNSDFYWIGGSGNWGDPMHWSLTSGGPPNIYNCIPNSSNNVFFDANSFNATNQIVTIDINPASCKSMDWTGALYNPALSGTDFRSLKIFGSLNFIIGMDMNFLGGVYFNATTTGMTIQSAGKHFQNYVFFNGNGGEWTLLDDFSSLSVLYLNHGSLNTNNKTVTMNTFWSHYTTNRSLFLGSSTLVITGNGNYTFLLNFNNFQLNAGSSKLLFTNNSSSNILLNLNGAVTNSAFYNIEFTGTAPTGWINNNTGGIVNFHNISFKGSGKIDGDVICNDVSFMKSGIINGNNTFHKLTFSPGYSYVLQSLKTQTIQSSWWIQGECTSYIIVMSSENGSQAIVSKYLGTVIGFNIHIRDINAIGGANYKIYNSVDLGNNIGLSFLSLPAMTNIIGITGPSSLCQGQTGLNFYISPVSGAISYLWVVPQGAQIIDGQGDTLITVDFSAAMSGAITVSAFNGCGYSTPSIIFFTVVQPVDAGIPQTICAGQSIVLIADWGSVYLWNNNDTGNVITVSPVITTTYTVTATYMGCISTDDVTITVNPLPFAEAGIDQTICAGQNAALSASGGSSYLWSTGSYNQNIIVSPNTTTIYYLIVTENGCIAYDNVTVNVNANPMANAGLDQTICSGQSVFLNGTGGAEYIWSPTVSLSNDSIPSPIAAPLVTTTYILTVTNSAGCTATDQITVFVDQIPDADAGSDTSVCEGSTVILTASGGANYIWSNGDNGASAFVTPSSTTAYTVTAINGNCISADEVIVTVNPLPDVNITSDIRSGCKP